MEVCEEFTCDYNGCGCSYRSYNNLLKHYRENVTHKPVNFARKKPETAKETVERLIAKDVPQRRRLSVVKEVVEQLSNEELVEFALPRLCKNVSVWEFLSKKCETRRKPSANTVDILQQLNQLRSDLFSSKFSGLANIAFNNSCTTPSTASKPPLITPGNEKEICEQLLSQDNGRAFRETLMPMVYEGNKDVFREFAGGVVSSFGVGQKGLQDVLRNTWGKHLSELLGINVIPPKNEVVSSMNIKKKELAEKVGLTFERHGDLVVGYVDPKLYLEYFLSRPGTQLSIETPRGAVIIFAYTDLAPFLKWSRNFNGLTSLRVKVVEPYNLQSTVLSLAYYLDKDSYDNTLKAFSGVYNKLSTLKSICHEPTNSNLDVHYRCVGDGKERRSPTGHSTARSCYPVCDAPEHSSQLGDMTVVSDKPEWSVADSKQSQVDYKNWLGGRKNNNNNKNTFAASHLGCQGRINLSCCDMENYYPGTLHLAMRSAETLCKKITDCAAGKNYIQRDLYKWKYCITMHIIIIFFTSQSSANTRAIFINP